MKTLFTFYLRHLSLHAYAPDTLGAQLTALLHVAVVMGLFYAWTVFFK